MKTFFKSFGLAAIAIATGLSLKAALPTFRTFQGYGNSSAPANIVMPADPNSQIRIVSAFYTSDNAAGAMSFSTGTTAYQITATNQATSSITNNINSTNGLSVGSIIVLQQGGICYTSAVVTWNSSTNLGVGGGTNVVLATGGWGVATQVGADVYLMSTPSTWYVGAGTNAVNGDAIFVGNYGRPVQVQLGPATATNRLSQVSTHYDSQSQ